jgi:hypothetical protein
LELVKNKIGEKNIVDKMSTWVLEVLRLLLTNKLPTQPKQYDIRLSLFFYHYTSIIENCRYVNSDFYGQFAENFKAETLGHYLEAFPSQVRSLIIDFISQKKPEIIVEWLWLDSLEKLNVEQGVVEQLFTSYAKHIEPLTEFFRTKLVLHLELVENKTLASLLKRLVPEWDRLVMDEIKRQVTAAKQEALEFRGKADYYKVIGLFNKLKKMGTLDAVYKNLQAENPFMKKELGEVYDQWQQENQAELKRKAKSNISYSLL